MADYNAEVLIDPSTLVSLNPIPVAIPGEVLINPSILGSLGSLPVPHGAQDLVKVRPISYRLRGYYIGGATYEFWAGSSPAAPNPSGHPLVNIVIDYIISV